eukprot:6192490-Pleurochrysis_carterae.AAC.5
MVEGTLRSTRKAASAYHNADIIDAGKDAVHRIGWRANQNLIFSRDADEPNEQINYFVRAIADEDAAWMAASKRCNTLLQLLLSRVGVAFKLQCCDGE